MLFDVYTHDAQNRLVEATRSFPTAQSTRYFYDAAGQRVRKTVDGVTTQYVLDGNQLLEEYDGHGRLLRRYVHAGLDEPVRMNTGPGAQLGGGAEFYYHQDGLGSVVALSSAAGFMIEPAAYGPYGETAGPSPRGNPFRYTGREFDAETGLYYYRARYYSTGLGRFLEPDPIGFGDGLNVYAYVGNNPINFVDPLGLLGQAQGGGSISSPQPPSLIDSIAGFVGLEGPRGIFSGLSAFSASQAAFETDRGFNSGSGGLGFIAGPLRGGAAAVRAGQAGEAAVQSLTGLAKNTRAFLVNARNRIPDFVRSVNPATGRPNSIIESKNVASQALTRQLRDLRDLVGPNGRVDVALPPGARVTRPLREAFDNPRNPLFRIELPQ